MTKKIINYIIAANLAVLGAVGVLALTPASVDALNCNGKSVSIGIEGGKECAKSEDQKASIPDVIETVTNVLLFIIGAVAVIMIIIGGIRYTTSNGDASQVTAAKNTILYGVIGVIVALLAYAIVSFVVSSFTEDSASGRGGGSASS